MKFAEARVSPQRFASTAFVEHYLSNRIRTDYVEIRIRFLFSTAPAISLRARGDPALPSADFCRACLFSPADSYSKPVPHQLERRPIKRMAIVAHPPHLECRL